MTDFSATSQRLLSGQLTWPLEFVCSVSPGFVSQPAAGQPTQQKPQAIVHMRQRASAAQLELASLGGDDLIIIMAPSEYVEIKPGDSHEAESWPARA